VVTKGRQGDPRYFLILLENQITDRIAVEDEPGHQVLPVPLKNDHREILARILRLFSCYGGSLSSSTSGADRLLPGTLPSFRQVALPAAEESGEYCRVFCDQGEAGVYRLLVAAEGFLVRIRSAGAVFAVIDIAARPEI